MKMQVYSRPGLVLGPTERRPKADFTDLGSFLVARLFRSFVVADLQAVGCDFFDFVREGAKGRGTKATSDSLTQSWCGGGVSLTP